MAKFWGLGKIYLLCFNNKIRSYCFSVKFLNVGPDQCDQMVRLHIQYLAIYNNEHLVQYHKNGQSRFTTLPNMKGTLKKCQGFYNTLVTLVVISVHRYNSHPLFNTHLRLVQTAYFVDAVDYNTLRFKHPKFNATFQWILLSLSIRALGKPY